ncbi:radical SAM protein [Ancylobacter dichloromethanicus]
MTTPLERARQRMQETGQWDPAQFVGRRIAIGCVALEITQRCNLDCSACYLSEHSEAVKDLPLEEVFRRIDMIHDAYGSDVDIQVTGGDPTLRKTDELVSIVQRISERGMRPALFTNGIRATRALLTRLVDAGLIDVAFHVDMTQERRGYASESELNKLRLAYIERAGDCPWPSISTPRFSTATSIRSRTWWLSSLDTAMSCDWCPSSRSQRQGAGPCTSVLRSPQTL